ncbi:hypothetical protein FHS42_007488 [Streptomyces zagrosensis]|uniref:Uncharacterized protein n=1 Tax=Streptomyces zagrosensis TaxID=1042984 RepID=A0A7W9QHK1_9ACTN|nr:hypothetical protein [Streptomyces zagrosensis]
MEPCTPPHQGFGCFSLSVTVAEPCRSALRWATSGWHESPGKAPPALSSCRVGSRHSGTCSRPQAPGEHRAESLRMPSPRGLGLYLAQWDTPPRNRSAAPGINLVGNSDAQLCAFLSRRAGPRNRAFLCGVSRARPSASGASPFVSETRPSTSGASPFASEARCRASRPASLAGQVSVSRTQVSVSPRSRGRSRRSATRGLCATAAVATRRRRPCRRRRLVRGHPRGRIRMSARIPRMSDGLSALRCDAGPPSRRAEDGPQRGPGTDRGRNRAGDRAGDRDDPQRTGTDRSGEPGWGTGGDRRRSVPSA